MSKLRIAKSHFTPPLKNPDTLTANEIEFFERISNIELRNKYASRIYWLIVGWLTYLGIVLLLQGFSLWGFTLSESILKALIYGTTTASILGLLGTVIQNLFPKRK